MIQSISQARSVKNEMESGIVAILSSTPIVNKNLWDNVFLVIKNLIASSAVLEFSNQQLDNWKMFLGTEEAPTREVAAMKNEVTGNHP